MSATVGGWHQRARNIRGRVRSRPAAVFVLACRAGILHHTV
jgi:hypothetical protein